MYWYTIIAEQSKFDKNKYALVRMPTLIASKLRYNIIKERLGHQSSHWTVDDAYCESYNWLYYTKPYSTFMRQLDLPPKPTPNLLLVHPLVWIVDVDGNRIVRKKDLE